MHQQPAASEEHWIAFKILRMQCTLTHSYAQHTHTLNTLTHTLNTCKRSIHALNTLNTHTQHTHGFQVLKKRHLATILPDPLFSICPVHAVNRRRGSRDMHPHILNFGTRRKCVVSFAPRPYLYPLNGKLSGVYDYAGRFGWKKSLATAGIPKPLRHCRTFRADF